MRKTITYSFIAVISGLSIVAQAWDYPVADNADVRDLSFYEPCEEQPPRVTAEKPDRVILCIGDGMGFNHLMLARQYAVGLDGRLHLESLPVRGVVRTCSADNAVTDSAAAATAMACGIKTKNGMIGMSPDKQPRSSILELLDQKGWRTGLVATSTITHATPAAFAAHVKSRASEAKVAAQMLQSGADVLFGGGRKYWEPLIAEASRSGFQVVYNSFQLANLQPGCVLGLFAEEGMTTLAPEPSLPQMAQKAVELLSAPSGDWFAPEPRFFLMVEGSQIDWAGHDNNAEAMIRQLLLFDMAVKEVLDFAARDQRTLVIVTADHETGGLTLIEDNGRLRPRWSTKDHTGADVPLFAYGPGADDFAGPLDNTEIFSKLAQLTGVDHKIKTLIKQPQ